MLDVLQVKLYTDDYIFSLADRVENLQFSTKLHGGFAICSFTIKMDLYEAWTWINYYLYDRLTVTDNTKLLWEGRTQEFTLIPGALQVVAYGYWASLRDQVENTAYNNTADVVIKAALTAHAPSISADQSNIGAPGVTIDSAAGDDYVDISVQDLIIKLLDFGTAAGVTWWFAVWDDRIPYMKAQSANNNWYVRLSDLQDFALTHDTSELWNSVYSIYTVAGVLTRTGTSTNAASIAKYGTRLYAVPNLGEVAAAAAQAQRDTWLAAHQEIHPNFETLILGDKIYDIYGKEYPSSWIRAGDAIKITDLVPNSALVDSITQDALRSFFILETNYDADSRLNSLKLDTQKKTLTATLSREL